MANKLKLMAEYGGTVLWGVGADNIGVIDPGALPITNELREAIRAWADAYDRTLDQDYPPDSGFTDLEEEEAFEEEGKRLWRELQSQLGRDWEIIYYSESDHSLRQDPSPNGEPRVTHDVSPESRQPLIGSHFLPPNFEISWAGEDLTNLTDSGFCFGSEAGEILFKQGDSTKGMVFRCTESDEAVNGVAFLDNLIAVSTPGEVVFFNTPSLGKQQVERAVYPGGAHGIISTTTGKFVAPLGTRGLLLMDPQPGERQAIKTFRAKGETFNFYKTAAAGKTEGRDVLACALRQDGWATVVRGESSGSLPCSQTPVSMWLTFAR